MDECCICYENKNNCIKDICESCKLIICQECSDKINAMCPVCNRNCSENNNRFLSRALFSIVSMAILSIFFNNGYFSEDINYFLENEIFISFVNEIVVSNDFFNNDIGNILIISNRDFQINIVLHHMYPRVIEALELFLQN